MKRARRTVSAVRISTIGWTAGEKRLARILSISAVVLLVLRLTLFSSSVPRFGSKDIKRIDAVVAELMTEYGISAPTTVSGDTLSEVVIPQQFPLYDLMAQLRNRLESRGYEITEVRKQGATTLVSVGKNGKAAKHFRFKKGEARSGEGALAIIIDDFGYAFNSTIRDFLAFEAPLTLSILPGLDYTSRVAEAAQLHRKEVIIHLPMEPLNEPYKDDGYILLTRHDPGMISLRIRKAFAEVPQAVGMNNHQGSKATADMRTMQATMETLKALGKYFIDSSTSTQSIAYRTARRGGVPCGRNSLFIDAEEDEQTIRERLRTAAEKAQKGERLIVIGHARPLTLQVLKQMLPRIQASGVQIVPVSQLVN
ncbi:MAG: divergent polysaccharide deacetylase family protein [candidate division KSB1 bacterium]|nr:divergent polysaccharide deacetylase family protein [candidate division KSB1 bacterium]